MSTTRSLQSSGTTRRDSSKLLRRARVATFGYFGLNGFVLGMWVVHIPSIEHHTGVSHATLGWLLLLLGLGAFAGMQAVGPLSDRLGPRRVVPTSAVLCSVSLFGPALATDAVTLGAALLILGVGNGCLDVSMNTHAVQVEARYGRPVMSAFHAVFSVGGFAAALIGAQTLALHWSARATLPVVAVIASLAAIAFIPGLLSTPGSGNNDLTSADNPFADKAASSAAPSRTTRNQIRLLAALAFGLMLTEGVANDWSTLAARDGLGVSASVAALAYGAFAGAMTIGRFSADRVSAAFGRVAILRVGAVGAALGLAVVAFSPWIGLTIAGWAIMGLALSGCVPQLFSAAGHLNPAAAGANVSRVAGLGYIGMLAGPAAIGPLTHLFEIQHTFVLPLVLCVAVAFAAPFVDKH